MRAEEQEINIKVQTQLYPHCLAKDDLSFARIKRDLYSCGNVCASWQTPVKHLDVLDLKWSTGFQLLKNQSDIRNFYLDRCDNGRSMWQIHPSYAPGLQT